MNIYKPVFSVILLVAVTMSCSDDNESQPQNIFPVKDLHIFDINNRHNSSDIRTHFTTVSPSNLVTEYRLILTKTSSPGLTLEEANNLEASRFAMINNDEGALKVTLPAGLEDNDGDAVTEGVSYVAYVLSVSSIQSDNALSDPSNELTLEDKELFDIYVSSRSNHSVQVYDGVTAEFISNFVAGGSGGLSLTQDLYFGNDGHLYVSGRGNTAIKKYNGATGAFMEDFTSGYTLDEPTKISIGPDGNLYVSQWGQTKDAVVKFDGTTGAFIEEIIPSLFQGMDHAWDQDSSLFVVSFGLGTLTKYDYRGNFIETVAQSPEINGPVNLWFSEDFSQIFVVDWENGDVKIFSPQGDFDRVFISGLTNVEGFAFRDDGSLFLCDWSENNVKRFAADGTFKGIFIGQGRLQNPNALAFGPNKDPL